MGYDNNTNEGHHRHFIRGGELAKEKIAFNGLTDLFERFEREVAEFESKIKELKINQ